MQREFGLPQDEARAYLTLLESHDLTAEKIAGLLGITANEAHSLLERMASRGLIIQTPGNPPKFTPLHPRMMLTNIFKVFEKEIVQSLRDRRATVDRLVYLLTPVYEDREK